MPFHKDFTEVDGVKEIEVQPEGWKVITIEYGYQKFSTLTYVFWRVKGTNHTIKITLRELNDLSKGDYGKHFQEILEIFRADFIDWVGNGLSADWMREYYEEYKEHIYFL